MNFKSNFSTAQNNFFFFFLILESKTNAEFKLTSYSVGSFTEYATVERWIGLVGIYAEGKNYYHDNSKNESKTNGNHVDDVDCSID